VYGRCGDIEGVCPDPVSAQVMMTFWVTAMAASLTRVHYVNDLLPS
jgi:hypothetical protein